MEFLFLLIPALALLNVYASVVVLLSSSYSVSQRFLQIALVWFVPALGAVICLVAASAQAAEPAAPSKFDPLYNPADGGGPDGPGLCSGGGDGGGD